MGGQPSTGSGQLARNAFDSPLLGENSTAPGGKQDATTSRMVPPSPWRMAKSPFQRNGSPPMNRVSSTVSTSSSSAPASFKSKHLRKTQEFIGSEKARTHKESSHSDGVDPRLAKEDTEICHEVSTRVAALILQHIEEGDILCGEDTADQDPFHKANFFSRKKFARYLPSKQCLSGCWHGLSKVRRRTAKVKVSPLEDVKASEETVLSLIDDVAQSLYFCKQVVVMCAIYIERLLTCTSVKLTSNNWSPLVIVGLLIASKVWEDVHPWNADFEDCISDVTGFRFRPGALNRLECMFLAKMDWKVFVDGEIYAAYFFALLDDGDPQHHQELQGCERIRHRCHSVDNFAITTIMEGEVYDTDEFKGESENQYGSMSGGLLDMRNQSTSGSAGLAPGSPKAAPSELPWSRGELLSDWRKSVLDEDEETEEAVFCCTTALKMKRDAWKLDANNPYIGSLRHAPVAKAPSDYIKQSDDTRWAVEISERGNDIFGRRGSWNTRGSEGAATTLSGATGGQLAAEMRAYLETRRAGGAAGGGVGAQADTDEEEDAELRRWQQGDGDGAGSAEVGFGFGALSDISEDEEEFHPTGSMSVSASMAMKMMGARGSLKSQGLPGTRPAAKSALDDLASAMEEHLGAAQTS